MSKSAVRDIDHGWADLAAEVKRIKGSHVDVGFMQGETREDDGETSSMVTVAVANEYGTPDIPERSFMRSTFDRLRDRLAKVAAGEVTAITSGKRTVDTSLRLMGEYFQGEVIRTIRNHPPPPNAPETIARKGSSGTLIDSGQMAQSVRYRVKAKGAPPVTSPRPAA